MAARHRKPSGLVLSAVSQLGVAVPAFLAGILLITLFAVKLGWLPANGWTPPAEDPVMFLKQLILPALSLGLVQGAVLTPLRPQRGARRAARGLPADRPGQGADAVARRCGGTACATPPCRW